MTQSSFRARGKRVLWSLRQPLEVLIDFIFPPQCLYCEMPLRLNERGVCSGCWNSITPVTASHPLYKETLRRLNQGGAVENLVSLVVFEKRGPFQAIVHGIKYRSMETMARDLGRRIGGRAVQWGVAADCIVPVPLHRRKLREREYNQAERIAEGIADMLRLPVAPKALRRVRYTQTQTKLGADERRRNVEDAFEVSLSGRKEVRGKICLLVDDVITTGATTSACAQALIRGGARTVIAVSAALAQRGDDSGT